MKLPRDPDFWWRKGSLAGYALAPLGMVYGRVAARRMAEPGFTPGIPVICVGNLVLGGAGKTPVALEIARVCRGLGLAPGFLTRGYGGTELGPVVVSTAAHTAAQVGDEALLLARAAPTIVSADRRAGARLLASLGVDVIVMDDGFQNPALAKDLSLVVVDAGRNTGNGLVFPAGPLRAPLAAQIRRADTLVLLGEGPGGDSVRQAARAGLPVLRAVTEPVDGGDLTRNVYLAFAGIADPSKFFASLAAAGAAVARTMAFPDHHLFTAAECEQILAAASEKGLVPITTEKDHVRLAGSDAAEKLKATTEVFPIRVRFEEPGRLSALIGDATAAWRAAHFRRRSDSSRVSDASASA